MFKIAGTFQGRQAEVTWNEGGRLSGDRSAVVAIRRLVEGGEEIRVAPTGPGITPSLATPEDAVVTISKVFAHSYSLTGDEPLPEYPIPPIPEGADA